jgi:hypothetical protein
MTASEIFDREFLELRAKVLELAASFDRIERGGGSLNDDGRLQKLHEAIRILVDVKSDRAEQVQLVFSLPYDDEWQAKFNLDTLR